MSRLDPPRTLLDFSFLSALVDGSDANHEIAVQTYAGLVDEFEAERILLSMLDVDYHDLDRSGDLRGTILAPVDIFRVAGQHRRAAHEALVDDPDLALTMVVMLWEGMARVATFDQRWAAFDVACVPPPTGSQQSGVGPTIDLDIGTGDEPGLVAAQEGDGRAEIGGTTDGSTGNAEHGGVHRTTV